MLGEFVGTMMFLFFGKAAGQIANNKPDTVNRTGPQSAPSLLQLIFISAGFGVGLAVNVWIFFRVSGGMFNPAVTAVLCLVGAVPWIRVAILIPVQLAAGIAASAIVAGPLPGPLVVQTSLGADTSTWQGLLIEMMLTGQLIRTILMLAVEKHRATFMAPPGIGLALFIGHLIGKPYSNSLLYKLKLIFLQYQTANWGQDNDGLDVYRIVSRRRDSNERTSSLAHLI
ncbi:aquaporin-like protein [Stipitochalara longipes BDJ]|nr:aquaporin-like protein [Stipitochalara longipes BDJ]